MIQLQFLNSLLKSQDSSLLSINNLNKEFFSDYTKEFEYIKEHLDTYGKIPDTVSFLDAFPDFDIIEVNESNNYLIDELYKDKNKRDLATVFNRVRTLLQEDRVEDAMQLFTNASQDAVKAKHLDCVDLLKDTGRYDAYVERCQDFNKFYVKTGFKELDEIIGGWDRQEELATIVARPNVGKCLKKGTEVLMADGSLKKVEDVQVGDRVQSVNGINTVLALHNGVSNGYEITPTGGSGKPFTISSQHILTLWKRNTHWDKERKMSTTDGTGELVDIQIEDYLNLSETQRSKYRLYRAPVEYPEKDLNIPPYILGLWLGDGTSCRAELTTVDEPIREEWEGYAKSLGYIARYNPKSLSYEITAGRKTQHENPVSKAFQSYQLFNNKHIPLEYLTSSREQRLELLAGIVDTDGWLNEKGLCIQITQKSKTLIDDICRLLSGLGFKYVRYNTHNKKYDRDYYAVNFYGELESIPCRLERKVFQHEYDKSRPRRNPLTAGFTIREIPEIEYYGFMCDGDSRYLLADNTVTHNTWMLLKCAVAAVEQDLNVGIYSGEMSERKVGYRIDTLISHLPNSGLTRGDLSLQNMYKTYLNELPNKYRGSLKVLTPNMIGGPAGVTSLRAFIEKEDLDILFIDQHSLLEDDRKAKSPVEKAANISKDLKNLQVLKHIPIISVSQQNRNSTENGVGLEHVAQADRIGQDSTIVLFFEREDNNIINMHLVKSRDSVNMKKLSYSADFNRGKLLYIPEETNALDGAGAEELKAQYEDDGVDVF